MFWASLQTSGLHQRNNAGHPWKKKTAAPPSINLGSSQPEYQPCQVSLKAQCLRSSLVISVVKVEAKTLANWKLFLLKYQCEQNKISTDPFKLLMETDERKCA